MHFLFIPYIYQMNPLYTKCIFDLYYMYYENIVILRYLYLQ